MDCIYCNDAGMTCTPITGPTTAPLTWAICGCAAGVKIASRLALKSRPGLDVPTRGSLGAPPPPCPTATSWSPAPCLLGWRHFGTCTMSPEIAASMVAGEGGGGEDGTPTPVFAPGLMTTDEEVWPKGKVWRPTATEKAEAAKTPADRLADAVEAFRRGKGGEGAMIEALNDYRSTRAAHPTFNAIVGNPPDPIMLARLTIDALTGGALSSLICQVHDNVVGGDRSTRPASTWAWKENLLSNLRALGEKLP